LLPALGRKRTVACVTSLIVLSPTIATSNPPAVRFTRPTGSPASRFRRQLDDIRDVPRLDRERGAENAARLASADQTRIIADII